MAGQTPASAGSHHSGGGASYQSSAHKTSKTSYSTGASQQSSKGSDFSSSTVWSLLGLLEPHEFLVSVDHFALWRRHLAWSKHDGAELRTHMTQRFASSMVFVSLLLSAELGVLFNSSKVTTDMRLSMMTQNYSDIKFTIGTLVFLSVFLTLFTLMATFCAWGMVSAVSDTNAHCLIRSSIGQYVTQLPSRLLVSSVYCFIVWMFLWLVTLLPGIVGKLLLTFMVILFLHIIASFSAFGRLIMLNGGMGDGRIFDEDFEQALLPSGLHTAMLLKAKQRQQKRLTVTAQYSDSKRQMDMKLAGGSGSQRDIPSAYPTQKLTASSTSNASIERKIAREYRFSGAKRAAKGAGRPGLGPKSKSKPKPPKTKPTHRRNNTDDSDLSNASYLIARTADAFSGRNLMLDSDVLAGAGINASPMTPPVISPTDTMNKDDGSTYSSSSSNEYEDSLNLQDISADLDHEEMSHGRPPPSPADRSGNGNKIASKTQAVGGSTTTTTTASSRGSTSNGGVHARQEEAAILESTQSYDTAPNAYPSYGEDHFKESIDNHHSYPSSAQRGMMGGQSPGGRRFGVLNKSVTFQTEWEKDEEARSMYDAPSAASPDDYYDYEGEDELRDMFSPPTLGGRRRGLPSASLLNKANHSRHSLLRVEDQMAMMEELQKQDSQRQKETFVDKANMSIESVGTGVKKGAGQLQKGVEDVGNFLRKMPETIVKRDSTEKTAPFKLNKESAEFERNDLEQGQRPSPERQHLLGNNASRERQNLYVVLDRPLHPVESIGDLEFSDEE